MSAPESAYEKKEEPRIANIFANRPKRRIGEHILFGTFKARTYEEGLLQFVTEADDILVVKEPERTLVYKREDNPITKEQLVKILRDSYYARADVEADVDDPEHPPLNLLRGFQEIENLPSEDDIPYIFVYEEKEFVYTWLELEAITKNFITEMINGLPTKICIMRNMSTDLVKVYVLKKNLHTADPGVEYRLHLVLSIQNVQTTHNIYRLRPMKTYIPSRGP